jgi:hypothetical protein
MPVGRFRKRPVVIEAIRWTGDNVEELWDTFGAGEIYGPSDLDPNLRIDTLEGVMVASVGDWIIRGVRGELYPCKPDIFEATYELVN